MVQGSEIHVLKEKRRVAGGDAEDAVLRVGIVMDLDLATGCGRVGGKLEGEVEPMLSDDRHEKQGQF